MLTRIKASVEKIMIVWKCGDSEKNRGDGWEVYESVWKCGDGWEESKLVWSDHSFVRRIKQHFIYRGVKEELHKQKWET